MSQPQKLHYTLIHINPKESEQGELLSNTFAIQPAISNTATGFMPDTPLMTCQILVHSPYGVLQSRFVLNVWLKLCNCLNLSRKSGIAHHSPLQFHRQVSTYLQHFTKWKDRTHSCGNSTCNKWIASQTCPQLHLRPKFGWVLAWKTNTSNLSYCSVTSHHVSVASSDDFLHKFWEVEENHRPTPTFRKSEWWWRTLRKATVVLILADSCHENLKQRASASIGLKLSADSSHLNALFDLGINLRNSLMWLKGTLRCNIRACSPYWPTEPRTKFSTSLAC